tara:strand:+ start:604 stop:954 length:351 start_codon:yes stop_codon:yes gene_type:complete
MEKIKGFDREEFEKVLIKDDDITLTSCCNRKYYKTKKNFKCPGCKKLVTKDIVGRGIMKGINQMMKDRDEKEIKKLAEEAKESEGDSFDSWLGDLEEKEQPKTCDIDDEDCEACGS